MSCRTVNARAAFHKRDTQTTFLFLSSAREGQKKKRGYKWQTTRACDGRPRTWSGLLTRRVSLFFALKRPAGQVLARCGGGMSGVQTPWLYFEPGGVGWIPVRLPKPQTTLEPPALPRQGEPKSESGRPSPFHQPRIFFKRERGERKAKPPQKIRSGLRHFPDLITCAPVL